MYHAVALHGLKTPRMKNKKTGRHGEPCEPVKFFEKMMFYDFTRRPLSSPSS